MKTYYYVYKVGGNAQKYKHKTRLKAQTEAERLAAKHPGDHFEILACVGISSTPVPKVSTFWMDKESQLESKSEYPRVFEEDKMKLFPPKSFENAPTVTPVVGRSYLMRNGKFVKIVDRHAAAFGTLVEFVGSSGDEIWYHYNSKGKNSSNAQFDLVEQCPF